MSDADIEYWRKKYSLLEEQFNHQKSRNEELEERLLHMVEKVESEKKKLADEIDALTRKLECLSGRKKGDASGSDDLGEPEDPLMTDSQDAVQLSRASQQKVILGAPNAKYVSHQTKGYLHFPVLGFEEGLIYGFRWEKGSVVKIV
ncbi:hypothetical protein OESDEN_10610 [Oesophagostomum dentatum]|uniref:Uncharacterized protein n=1 Tax=Oesophagostomum dentatum TaxID=61180 RepID=A0A0B1SW85_OESDE|nr:hypothetical protein OESDEN_10610 [Oesophagostomum dentatum]